jgi:hypothetical protein
MVYMREMTEKRGFLAITAAGATTPGAGADGVEANLQERACKIAAPLVAHIMEQPLSL